MTGQTTVITNGIAALKHSVKDEVWGLCESSSLSEEHEKKELLNDQNAVIGTTHSKFIKKYSGTFIPLATATGDPIPTDTSFMGGKTLVIYTANHTPLEIVIDSVKEDGSRDESMKLSIEGTYYPAMEKKEGNS